MKAEFRVVRDGCSATSSYCASRGFAQTRLVAEADRLLELGAVVIEREGAPRKREGADVRSVPGPGQPGGD